MEADRDDLERFVRDLAAIDRPSASQGERRGAERIAAALAETGCDVRLDHEQAHGTYWWPLGVLCLAGGLAGAVALRGRRRLGGLVGAIAAAGIWDDVGGGSLWFRRLFLRRRATWNVVARGGDEEAERTVVVVAHHDAARSGAIYNPAIPAAFGDRFPKLLERATVSPPLLLLVFGGPALVAAGALRSRRVVAAGTVLSLGAAAVFAEIATNDTVPGANDNLTGVAALWGIARELRARPVRGLRLLFVSCGSEESFQEGMVGFADRHLARLPRDTTDVLVLDTVGSGELVVPESEGMIVPRGYSRRLKHLITTSAQTAGLHVRRGLRFSFATDALVALRRGYEVAVLASVDRYKAPANYHWPSDTPDNVDYRSVLDAVRVGDELVRALAAERVVA